MMRTTLAFLLVTTALGTIPAAADALEEATAPLSLSATDVFSTSFAECGSAATQGHASEDVLAEANLPPCCACVDASGGLVCQCFNYPCACTPLATGQCRCVCGPDKLPAEDIVCLLLPESIYCPAPPSQDGAEPLGGLGDVKLQAE